MPRKGSKFFFVFGAGASTPAVPTMEKFLIEFSTHLRKKGSYYFPLSDYLERIRHNWEAISSEVLEFNLESLYEFLSYLNERNQASLEFDRGRVFKKGRESELLEYELKKYIQKRCMEINLGKIRHLNKLFEFIELSKTIDIVSLNYDVCIEKLCDMKGYACVDELGSANIECNKKKSDGALVRLHKLHGSVTWYEVEPGKYQKIRTLRQFDASLKIGRLSTPVLRGMLIYPGIGKDTPTGPFLQPALNFRKLALDRDFCISIGYRFSDRLAKLIIKEGFLKNKKLRLAIVNPRPSQVIDNLLPLVFESGAYSDYDLENRLLVIKAKAKKAFDGSYLLNRVKSWHRGEFAPEKETTRRYLNKSIKKIVRNGQPVEIMEELPENLYGITINPRNNRCYITQSGSDGGLIQIDLVNWRWEFLLKGLKHALGITLENQDGKETLYFIENICYQTPWLGAIEGKIGAGRLSRVVLEAGQALHRSLITCKNVPKRSHARPKSCDILWLEYKNYHKEEMLAKLHGMYGLLNWPNSLIIEKPMSSLLVTEARGLSRVILKSGEIQYLYSFPLCFNLNDLCWENKDNLILLDSGVAGKDSFGRLFRINKKSGKIKNYIAEGINRAEGFKINPDAKTVLLSQNHPYPYGRVCEISLSDGKELRCWKGLDEPRAIAISPDATYALVTSRRGLYRLTL